MKLCPICKKQGKEIPLSYTKQHYDNGDYDVIPYCDECGGEWS